MFYPTRMCGNSINESLLDLTPITSARLSSVREGASQKLKLVPIIGDQRVRAVWKENCPAYLSWFWIIIPNALHRIKGDRDALAEWRAVLSNISFLASQISRFQCSSSHPKPIKRRVAVILFQLDRRRSVAIGRRAWRIFFSLLRTYATTAPYVPVLIRSTMYGKNDLTIWYRSIFVSAPNLHDKVFHAHFQ